MRLKGTIAGKQFETEVEDEYDLKKQIEIVHERFKQAAEEHAVDLREDIVSQIANSIVRDANLFEEVLVGEVTTSTLPELPPLPDNADVDGEVKEVGHDQ
jgi:hypothetical protein